MKLLKQKELNKLNKLKKIEEAKPKAKAAPKKLPRSV